MLRDDSYRTGTSDTPVCECGLERESVEHFLLHCNRFQEARNRLKDTINDISDSSARKKGYVCLKLCCWHRSVMMLPVRKKSSWRMHSFSLYLKHKSSSSFLLSTAFYASSNLFYWETFLQWCLYCEEATVEVLHFLFSPSVSTSLFTGIWNSAHRGLLKKSKKKKLRYVRVTKARVK